MKILILRFSSIGDIVLTSPVIRVLQQQLGAEIHFLTKSAFAPVLSPNPYLHRVWSFQKEVTEVLPQLRQERFDWVIDLHHNLRSLRVKWALRRPSRSFDKLNFEKWLLVQTGINRLPRQHIVHRYLQTVAHLGVHYDGEGLDYFIPPDQECDPSSLSPQLAGGYFAFVIGATHATKRLPEPKIIEVCQTLQKPVVLLGGAAEAETGARVAAASGPLVVNLCQRLSLHQSASLVLQAEQVITHDTGLMHIAAAFRKPIVSVWGNTVPAFGMFPFYPDGMDRNVSLEVSGLNCRPCSKIGHKTCPKGHFRCLNDLKTAQICAALDLEK
ncbi:MAG: glycosyltransferase family 9 protein [Saprospiraceae bacterium]|nr:glycosyltransferase family 9 protein [Saprospiraceae bacterium]